MSVSTKEVAKADLKIMDKTKRKYTRRVKKAKRGPGRPKGSGRKGKAGRPKGATVNLKGYVKRQEAKRFVKEAVAAFKTKLPKLIKRELKRMLK